MTSSILTLQLESDAATALRKLDGQLITDDIGLEDVLQQNLYRVICGDHDRRGGLLDFCQGRQECWDREDVVELRELTDRLGAIVSVYEALQGIDSRLARLRQLMGWTREDLAAKLGVESDAVMAWEQGEDIPDIYAEAMAEFFGGLWDVFGRTDGEPKSEDED